MKDRVQKWIPREYAELADDIARHINERIRKGELLDEYEAGVKGSTIIARALSKGLKLIMEEVDYRKGSAGERSEEKNPKNSGAPSPNEERSFLDNLWRG